ncbi:MAG: hypothetical protein Fur0012_03390 [Elusimicrobiota bacterium]
MENADKKEVLIAEDREIFFIFLIFSFLFYALYPGEKLTEYAVKENRNLDLTELYLKNITKKYSQDKEAFFALADIYLKQGKPQKAAEVLIPLARINDKALKDRLDLYRARTVLYSLDEQKNLVSDLENLKNYYCSSGFWALNKKEELLDEYASKLISLKLYDEAFDSLFAAIKKSRNLEDAKIALKTALKSLRTGGLVKKRAADFKNIENLFTADDEAANEILKVYLEAGRPDMAREYAIKILKLRKII